MSTLGQILLGIGIWAALVAAFLLISEIDLWFSMRQFRDEDPAFQAEAKRRLRRAWWRGVASIGFHRTRSPRRTR